MLRLAFLIALSVATVPVAAEPYHVKGSEDGVSFDYTAKLQANDNLVISGTYLDTNEQFTLTVAPSGHVEGMVGYNPVAFDVTRKVRDRAIADLRAHDTLQLAERSVER